VSATPQAPDVLEVADASTDLVGDVAAANGVTIHELSLVRVTLEEAFMELTHDSIEYRTDALATNSPSLDLLPEESMA
jgi:ABC-2 type transport system ATP-binding protein